jgi:hypothetical protein
MENPRGALTSRTKIAPEKLTGVQLGYAGKLFRGKSILQGITMLPDAVLFTRSQYYRDGRRDGFFCAFVYPNDALIGDFPPEYLRIALGKAPFFNKYGLPRVGGEIPRRRQRNLPGAIDDLYWLS